MGSLGRDDTVPGHVIHLPVAVDTLDAATELAALLTESLAFLPELDAGEVTVSAEDAQHERYRVFCDRLLFGSGRCGEREGHRGACVAGPTGTPPTEHRTLIYATSTPPDLFAAHAPASRDSRSREFGASTGDRQT